MVDKSQMQEQLDQLQAQILEAGRARILLTESYELAHLVWLKMSVVPGNDGLERQAADMVAALSAAIATAYRSIRELENAAAVMWQELEAVSI